MLAEVQAYIEAMDAANQVYTEDSDKLYDQRHAGEITHEVFRRKYSAVREANRAALANAATKLGESNDPLVRFIAENAVSAHHREALKVLKVLPATRAELETLAVDNGWCGTWDDLVAAAEKAGALPPVEGVEAELVSLQRWLQNELGVGSYNSRVIRERVQKLVNDALEREKAADGPQDAVLPVN